MAQSIATDADGTTATADEIENHVAARLDWLRPRLIAWGRALPADDLTPSRSPGREARRAPLQLTRRPRQDRS